MILSFSSPSLPGTSKATGALTSDKYCNVIDFYYNRMIKEEINLWEVEVRRLWMQELRHYFRSDHLMS